MKNFIEFWYTPYENASTIDENVLFIVKLQYFCRLTKMLKKSALLIVRSENDVGFGQKSVVKCFRANINLPCAFQAVGRKTTSKSVQFGCKTASTTYSFIVQRSSTYRKCQTWCFRLEFKSIGLKSQPVNSNETVIQSISRITH